LSLSFTNLRGVVDTNPETHRQVSVDVKEQEHKALDLNQGDAPISPFQDLATLGFNETGRSPEGNRSALKSILTSSSKELLARKGSRGEELARKGSKGPPRSTPPLPSSPPELNILHGIISPSEKASLNTRPGHSAKLVAPGREHYLTAVYQMP